MWPFGGEIMFDPASIGAALTSTRTIIDLLRNANDAQLAMKISSEVANLRGLTYSSRPSLYRMKTRTYAARLANWKVKLSETVEAEPCPPIEQRQPERHFDTVHE
jgi:hypothetical protein